MRKTVFFTFYFCLIGLIVVSAQTRRASVKPPSVVPAQVKVVTEISGADWKTLADALVAENWNKSAALAAGHLQSLKSENEKKQLAQLRYIYLYALAGKILAFNAQKNAVEAEKTWTELDRVMAALIGREFILPARPFAGDCDKKLNYICQVKDNPKTLRTTATNKEADSIHSFDYVQFDQPIELDEFREKETFLGGTLQKAEYNEDASKPWVLRLFFNKGFVRIVK